MPDKYVQVNEVLRKDEATAARRVIVYPVTTAEVSLTEEVSKNGAALAASTAIQAVVSGLVCSLTIPAGDLDTVGLLFYKLQGATDDVYLTGIRVSDDANEIADEVLKEVVADHDGTSGSFAELLRLVAQAAGNGKVVTDTSDDTIKVYDTDNSTVLKTWTKSTAGTVTTWTPS